MISVRIQEQLDIVLAVVVNLDVLVLELISHLLCATVNDASLEALL